MTKETKYICTYFDFNFLPRGLALYYSLKKHHSDFLLFILTFDEKTYNFLWKLNETQIVLISFKEYDLYFKTSAEKFIDKKQYYFSATPNLCLYVLKKWPDIDILLYLDADVYVYNSLDTVYDEFSEASIGFCSHRFNYLFKILSNNYGKYNVGVNFFRNDSIGLKCLLDWKNDCDSWYPNKPDYPLSFFSDQILLDNWPVRYNNVKILKNIGVNTAPWNAINYKFTKIRDIYYVNGNPLIIYHFSSLRKIDNYKWTANTIYFFASVLNILLEIYKEYIIKIESFGLPNQKLVMVTHKDKFIKKIFLKIAKNFINENIVITNPLCNGKN